jgi:hypothetical protein
VSKRKLVKKKSTAGGGARKKTGPTKRAGKKPAKRATKKPTKQATKKTTKRADKKTTKRATKKPPPRKTTRGHGAAEVPGRAASRIAVTAVTPTPSRSRASRGSSTAAEPPAAHSIDDLPLDDIDVMRIVNNLDRKPGDEFPRPHHRGGPSPGSISLVEDTLEREARLDKAAPRLSTGSEAELLQSALWIAGGVRLPRAAIVGRALHELKSFTEADASSRGTADQICEKINHHNKAHLSKAIQEVRSSSKNPTEISASLAGLLKRAWLVLQELKLLKAAYRSGVYLDGLGQRVFDGFPDWNKPDEKLPKRLIRPSTKPRP